MIFIMFSRHVDIQVIFSCETFLAHFAVINKGILEVNTFNVFPQISSITANFPANTTAVCLWSMAGIFHDVLIKGKRLP